MTTPTPIPQLPDSREKFEAWWLARDPLDCNIEKRDNGSYLYGRTQAAWNAWQAALASQPVAVVPEVRTFDQWWTEIENFAMRGERLCELLSKPALAQVAYDEGLAASHLLPARRQDRGEAIKVRFKDNFLVEWSEPIPDGIYSLAHSVEAAGQGELRVKVCYLEEGQPPFVFWVHGKATADAIGSMNADLEANRDDILRSGYGDYEITGSYYPGQYGFEGRCELAPGWEFNQVGFEPLPEFPAPSGNGGVE